ncbi:MAG: hypothetical protein F4099_08490 [Synechococcus sp. SB0673_bin_10]|nr:hypothetical protein [Cyanobacteria bacterium MAG IRC1_bin_28]MXX09383.1 hypothetical protein [Synechococcus sp. SB0667_bin_8]MYG64003.1 hypothetical protein [Synechococcus sp. SB0675_bin_7]MYI72514.1 hypothetical protein [Synechococcus sp. SB0673_bin_10]MYK84961.1 hypothetical protein [Synechococcus sp. SB0669_bin_7]
MRRLREGTPALQGGKEVNATAWADYFRLRRRRHHEHRPLPATGLSRFSRSLSQQVVACSTTTV